MSEKKKSITKIVLLVIALFIFLWKLILLKKLLIWFFVATVITLITRPVVHFLKSKLKFHNGLATGLVLLGCGGVLLSIFSLVIPLIINIGEQISSLDGKQLTQQVQQLWTVIQERLYLRHFNLSEALSEINLSEQIKMLPEIFSDIFSGISDVGLGLLCIIFISFFLIKDEDLLHHFFFSFVPNDKSKQWKTSLDKIKALLSRYFIGVVVQISILFVMYVVLLIILSIENALPIALLCALLNIIPFVGPLIGFLLMTALTITGSIHLDFHTQTLPKIYYIAMGYALAQIIDNFLIQPLVFSKSVRSHPLEIFLVITATGLAFGVFAMVLAVPCYTALKVILTTFFREHPIVKKLFNT